MEIRPKWDTNGDGGVQVLVVCIGASIQPYFKKKKFYHTQVVLWW